MEHAKGTLVFFALAFAAATSTCSAGAAIIKYSVDATIRVLSDDSLFSFNNESLEILASFGIVEGAGISIVLDIDDSPFPISTAGGSVSLSDIVSVSSFVMGDLDLSQATSSDNFGISTGTSSSPFHSIFFGFTSQAVGPLSPGSINLFFQDETQTALEPSFHPDDIDVQLFAPFATLEDFVATGTALSHFSMFTGAGSSQGFIQAEIHSFARAVPIPSALWLFFSAFSALVLIKPKRHH